MITAIIRNKENTLVLDLPRSIYDLYEKLQSVGIMEDHRAGLFKKVWMLKTPTCLMNNICFYVNKCGFHIVKVEDVGTDRIGMFIFEK